MADYLRTIKQLIDKHQMLTPAVLDGESVPQFKADLEKAARQRIQEERQRGEELRNNARAIDVSNPNNDSYSTNKSYKDHWNKMADHYLQSADHLEAQLDNGFIENFTAPLQSVAASSGDKDRFDTWQEIKTASHLLSAYSKKPLPGIWTLEKFASPLIFAEEKDIAAYQKLRGLRGEINHALFEQTKGTLAQHAKKVPLRELCQWRSLPVFDAFATHVSALLEKTQKRTPCFLYPAAGTHYAFLQTVFRLAENNAIDAATIIATDIHVDPNKMLAHFQGLQAAQVIEKVELGKSYPNLNQPWSYFFVREGTEQTFTLFYRSTQGKLVPIYVKLALNRSGEAYFRDEYLKQADAVIIHDPGSGDVKDSIRLLDEIVTARGRVGLAREQLVLMEGGSAALNSKTIQQSHPTKIKGSYGHCNGIEGIGEFFNCTQEGAIVLSVGEF
ncbi:MAG: hypothetical protein COX62_02610 [Deltaproteobacteria bacterium CG_4_10_14_0_2_um_filter_43_8]|nr:MAG: hypothetical protein COV43_07100 [Deltaproteobacteria bacterium CG11_big_fil_rev_8_21_14_0_20_42_23]PJA21405.1 MAG: hypothetical protein COX62_02610 [Deltaproteobacteria bacterium CG_4_10_14_0_2_um_filter_43_8]PJC63870.1 MAG: hypothetical protein CO021_07285 [Deltaproteobacteria bacterium CG_4_9_14_0_2_um_filter_42_21]